MTGNLPGILAEIAEICGGGAALKVAAAKGGLEKVHIPPEGYLKPGHWLVEAVGLSHAQAIARRLGGEKWDIPLGPFAGSRARTHQALDKAMADGQSTASAARLAGVHQRTARRHKSRGGDTESVQLALPLNGR